MALRQGEALSHPLIRRLGAALAALLLCTCGVQPTPNEVRPGLFFGYYGDCVTCAMETRDHVNLYWASGFDSLPTTMQELFNARAAGIPSVVLAVPAYTGNPEGDVRFFLTSLQAAGYLENIVALYPIDEPDGAGKTDAQVRATNAMLRRVMADYPELAAAKLAVIYTNGRKWPGIDTYDWVGFDDYDAGCGALSSTTYADMKARLRPDQRILILPGGADPWRQDPGCFLAQANADAQVIAVVPFIWFDNYNHAGAAGIRSNPTRGLYCSAGKKVTGIPGSC